jgi:hypothetical protein
MSTTPTLTGGRQKTLKTAQITNGSRQPGIDMDQASQLAHPVLKVEVASYGGFEETPKDKRLALVVSASSLVG